MPSVLLHLPDHSKTYIFLCRPGLDGKARHSHNWKMYDLIAWVGPCGTAAQCNCEDLATELTEITGTKHISPKSLWFWWCQICEFNTISVFWGTLCNTLSIQAPQYTVLLFSCGSFSFAVLHAEEMPHLPKPNLEGSPSSRCAIAVRHLNWHTK